MLTVMLHEVGHLAGFSNGYSGFESHIETQSGSPLFVTDNLSATLNGDHLDPNIYPTDLLNPIFSPSVRNLPSTLDVQLLNAVRSYTGSTENTLGSSVTAQSELTSTISSLAKAATGTPGITAALVNDTAASGTNTDGITYDPTIAGKITGTKTIKKFSAGFDNTPKGKFFNVLPDLKPDGSFSFDIARLQQIYGGKIPDGSRTLHLWALNEKGNSDKLLLDVSFTFDTQPALAPTGLNLLAGSDSGTSLSDRITNNTTPTVFGNAEPGSLVQLESNGQLVGQTTATAAGTWEITTSNLAVGTQALRANTIDVAGNVSPATTAFNVEIDTLAPTVPIGLRLTTSTDTGASNSDNITNNTTPQIQGTGDAGSLLRLFKEDQLVGQTTVNADGEWFVSVEMLSDGLYNFTATSEDLAGNVSAFSDTVAIAIDTTAAAPIGLDLLALSDSGTSLSDNITNNTTPTISGNAEPGALVQLESNGQLVGQTTATSEGTWEITTNNLADGTQALRATTIDVAGNVSSASDPLNVEIDTLAPTMPIGLRLTTSTDTGTSNSDNITNNTTPQIQGTGDSGSLIRLFQEDQLVGQTTVNADGEWLVSVETLSDGLYNFTATSEDIAGNVSAFSDELAIAIDTTAAAPTSLDLLALSDSGTSLSDNITNNTTPTVLGNAEPGTLVQLESNGQLIGQTTTTSEGTWEIATSNLVDGTQALRATTIDVAGNVSSASDPLNVEIDTLAPNVPIGLRLTASTDTGASNSDNITNNTTPQIQGTGDSGSLIRLFQEDRLVGQTTVNADGEWLVSVETLSDGEHTLKATSEDIAGNLSSFSEELTVTVNTTAPYAPTGLDLLADNDTGSSSSDNVTNETTPTITGSAQAGSLVQLESNGQLVGQTTATSEGTWEITTNNLADGTQALRATATDVAGNKSLATTLLNVEIDTVAPTAPIGLRLTASTDTGASNSDNITSNTTPTIQGKGDSGTLIRVFKDIQLLGQTTASADGDWLFSSSTLSDGEHTFTATAEDIAGNVSASSGQLVVTIEPTTDNSLTVALADLYGLDPYPDAVTLVPGSTRQLSVKLNGLPDSPDLTASSTGTQYSVSNPDVLSVSPDGALTALSYGEATVTVTYGEEEVVIPVQVEAPQVGPAAVGVDGGVVQASDGSMVAIAPGALDENTTVSLTPLSQSDLSLPVPEGFEVAGAFNLEMGDDALSVPAQLAIRAPEGLPVGTEVVFMRKGALPDETGTWNPIWLQEESGVVGADGMISTQSPPYPGVVREGEYMVAYDSPTGSATLVKGKVTLNYNFPLAFFGFIVPGKAPGGSIGQLLSADNFVTTPAFTVSYDISSVKVIAVPTVGLPVVTTVGVQRNDNGIATFEANLDMPSPTSSDPTASPVLQKVELKFKDSNNQPFADNEPVLFLRGGNILVNNSSTPSGSSFNDLTVNFYVGSQAYEGIVLPSLSQVLPNNQFEVALKVPNTVPLGSSRIVLSRKQDKLVGQIGSLPIYQEINFNSNSIRLRDGGEYVFAALQFSDSVAVMNGSDPESVVSTTSSNDLLLASIPVGTDSLQDRPIAIAVTSQGDRAYVTLEGTGSVALVDPIVLGQVDTQPTISGVNPISLPGGAKPRAIAISPQDEYAYIADASSGNIYVLDIDPSSATYHQVIQTISVSSAPTGLRQMAISSDGRKLFAAAPSASSRILVVNVDPKDRPSDSSQNTRKWHEQIGAVVANNGAEGLAATSNPLVMTFTNSRSDASGYGVLEVTNSDPLSFAATTRYASLNLGSINDYFDVNNAVATEVTDDLSYAFVVGRNAINFGLGIESIDGVQAGSNIGIIQDPLGPSPKLIAATRPIPGVAFATDLELDNDNKYLFASYPNAGGVYVFDVEEIINTIQNPGNYVIDNLGRGTGSPFFNSLQQREATSTDLGRVPIDDINSNISIAADYEILQEDRPRNQFVYGVPSGTTRAPIGTGGSPRGLAKSPRDWLDLMGPGTTTNDLTPQFEWKLDAGFEDVAEVNLFVSTFPEGEGLMPWDEVVDLSDNSILPGLSTSHRKRGTEIMLPWLEWVGSQHISP